MRELLKTLGLPFALLLIGFAIYGPALDNAFVMDDELEIVHNSLIQSLDRIGLLFRGSTMAQDGASALGGIYYRPMMMVSFAFVWSLSGADPFGFHLFQLLIHIANAVLVFQLMRRFFDERWAFMASALFLVHPLNTEAVVYSASLQDPLFLFFGLSGLLLAVRGSLGSAALAGAFFLGSLLSKETGLLVMILALALLLIERRRWLPTALAALGAIGIYSWLRFEVAGLTTHTDPTTQIARASLETRLLTVPAALWSYFAKFFFPRELTVTQDWVVSTPGLTVFLLPLLAIAVTATLAVVFLAKTRDRAFGVFFLLSVMGLGLHSHILVPIDGTVADRWFYLTSIGFVGMSVALAARLSGARFARGAIAVVGVAVVALGARAAVRASNWRDGATLYAHDLEALPDSFDLNNNYGVELFRQGKIREAKPYFEKSTKLAPTWTTNWNNLGAIHQRLGDLAKAEEYYARSIANGAYLLAYENYAGVLLQTGKTKEAKEFLERQALPRFPGSAKLRAFADYLRQSVK